MGVFGASVSMTVGLCCHLSLHRKVKERPISRSDEPYGMVSGITGISATGETEMPEAASRSVQLDTITFVSFRKDKILLGDLAEGDLYLAGRQGRYHRHAF